MELELIATNAKLETDRPDATTIWARDAAGNEVRLVLNERLTKRVVDAKVALELENLLAGLVPLSDTLREKTDAAEANLRTVHNDLFAALRSEIGIRKPREAETPDESGADDPVASAAESKKGVTIVTR